MKREKNPKGNSFNALSWSKLRECNETTGNQVRIYSTDTIREERQENNPTGNEVNVLFFRSLIEYNETKCDQVGIYSTVAGEKGGLK